MKKQAAYLDLHAFEEDQRIDMIGRSVMNLQATVAVCVDDEPGKAERYERKLKERFPGIRVLDVSNGPVPGVVTMRVAAPMPSN